MLWDALITTGDALDIERCWLHRKSFHFPLGDGRSLAITPDTAERIRVEVFDPRGESVGTRWVLPGDRERLTQVVNDLADEVNGEMQGVN